MLSWACGASEGIRGAGFDPLSPLGEFWFGGLKSLMFVFVLDRN
jgi:hypothetical protein